jgi:hypothetical protein
MIMRSRSVTTAALVLLTAAPLSAQMAGMNHDPDKKIVGGALPTGWSGRTDNASKKLEDAKFATEGGGYHVTSGPAAIYWKDANRVTVPFTASATFTQNKAPSHPEAYGIFYMGSKLDAPDQQYAYLLVRGDGKVMVKHRAGSEVHTIIDWTDNTAVHKADANGRATNTLSVAAAPDSTRLMVNGTQVAAIGGAYARADGVVGLRINHNLDVSVSDFTVKSGETKLGMTKAEKKAAKKAKKAAKKAGGQG